MCFEYLLPTTNSKTTKDFSLARVLTSRLFKLETLNEFRQKEIETIGKHTWNHVLWAQQHYKNKSFFMGDYVLWFPMARKTHTQKFKKQLFGPYRIQYCSPNNITL
jgi:hypothetical protein